MPIIITEFENLYLSLYLMAEIATPPYTKWQKSRPIPIPELKNCDPSERHIRTRHFLGVNPLRDFGHVFSGSRAKSQHKRVT